MPAFPIIFILGLSGTGKSKLGEWVGADLSFLHIEQDSVDGNGIDIWEIRNEWEEFLVKREPQRLLSSLRTLGEQANKKGAILTFSSMVRPSIEEMRYFDASGITTRILYGSDEDCLHSYLQREKETGRGYDEARWHKYNADTSTKFSEPEYKPYKLLGFDSGKHISRTQLINEIKNLLEDLE